MRWWPRSARGQHLGVDADRQLRRFAQVIEVAVAESTAREALASRATQQSVVAELGRRATEGTSIGELLDLACVEAAAALPADLVTVMETQGDGEILLHAASGTAEPVVPGHRSPAPTRPSRWPRSSSASRL